jgi:hypothetical protein
MRKGWGLTWSAGSGGVGAGGVAQIHLLRTRLGEARARYFLDKYHSQLRTDPGSLRQFLKTEFDSLFTTNENATNASTNGSQPIGLEQPITYHLEVAQYADTFGQAPDVVFVVGEVAYRSAKDLQQAVTHFPKGSTLRWAPSCRGPFGLSEKQEEELRAVCESHGVRFVHVPSG